MDERAETLNLLDGGVDAFEANGVHVGRSHARRSGDALTTVQEHDAPSNVLGDGVQDGVKRMRMTNAPVNSR